MSNVFDLTALGRWYGKAMVIPNLPEYAGPLMKHWERIIEEDNRKGVLEGTDKDGIPLIAVSYRPVKPGVKLTVNQRLGQNPGKRRGDYFGRGPAISGLNNNLTSSEYRKLDGPPLAPRRQFSRVITNLYTGSGRDPGNANKWFAVGAWREVVSIKGVHFLPFLFEMRDLRGVRPEGQSKMVESLHAWAKLVIREKRVA